MLFSFSAAAALLAGVAFAAEPLATITPCAAQVNSTHTPITVTKQYQTVSTCHAEALCWRNTCTTRYPFETFAYVSTVIPAAWDGKALHSTTVTSTTQTVTVSRFSTTITKYVTPTATVVTSGTTSLSTTVKPVYLTIAKDFRAQYDQIGPLAIPGYDGSGLCKSCRVQADGSRSQVVNVTECRSGPVGAKCMGYEETWISKAAPASSEVTHAACHTRFVAPTAGEYTFTFPFVAPARTMTAGPSTVTVGPSPYFVYATRRCHSPNEIIDFTTTITKTIYFTVPCGRRGPKTSSAVPIPTGKHAFPGFRPHHHGHDDGPDGDDLYDWADWGSDDVTDPHRGLPKPWADWAKTATETVTVTNTVGPYTTTTSAIGSPIDQSTTTSSSVSSSQGPIDQSTTTSSSATSSEGPIDQSTTTSSITTSSVTTSSITTSSVTTSSITTSSVTTSSITTSSVTTSSITTSSITTSSITTSSVTTSSAPATTTSTEATPGIPVTAPFFITSTTPSKYHKRATQYIGFSAGGEGILVSDKAQAAQFYIDINGYLCSNGQFVDADFSTTFIAWSLTPTRGPNNAGWEMNDDGTLTLTVANLGFCVSTSSNVFILFSDRPTFTCVTIILRFDYVIQASTTSSSTTATSTSFSSFTPTSTSFSTVTTTTADISGDLGTDPTPGPVRRGVQYGARHYYHHRRH